MRPHQWVKNLLVFAPLLFAKLTLQIDAVLISAIAFVLFCLLSSGIYLLNDVMDRERDALHPHKKDRPVAAGRLSVGVACAGSVALITGALALGGILVPYASDATAVAKSPFIVWPVAYLLINLAYSFWLKHVVIIDCVLIALGFTVRVLAGAAALTVPASDWILLCTFFLALFLAFCKRREEVIKVADATGSTRTTMREYDVPFLNQLISPLAALSILSYALYTVAPETPHGPNLKFTVPMVVFCVFRYLFLVYRRQEGGDPAHLIFRDVQMLIGMLVWTAVAFWAMATTNLG